ncbi:hypothetical protein [Microcoleus sp. Pol10D4]|uniref:hypothetical protein n=1 Tax=Microcoleus sp. Pol10D4 TaxID=3055387 RepID=UPI002FD59137
MIIGKKEEGRRKKEEGRRKKEEGRRKREEKKIALRVFLTSLSSISVIGNCKKSARLKERFPTG